MKSNYVSSLASPLISISDKPSMRQSTLHEYLKKKKVVQLYKVKSVKKVELPQLKLEQIKKVRPKVIQDQSTIEQSKRVTKRKVSKINK